MEKITQYKTEDGKVFDIYEEAKHHEQELKLAKFLVNADLYWTNEGCSPLAVAKEILAVYIIAERT